MPRWPIFGVSDSRNARISRTGSLGQQVFGRFDGGAPFDPSTLFTTAGSRGFFYDFSDYTTQFTDTAGTTAITGVGQSLARVNDKSGLGNNATQATAGSRALTQVRPMFTQRNRAVGSELPENSVYWQASSTTNGITVTKVASGIDTDGLPYADYSVSGTASADTTSAAYLNSSSRVVAASGQTYTSSFIARIIAGTPPPVDNGVRADVVGETAPTTFVEASTSTVVAPITDTVVAVTRALNNAATNQARGAVSIITRPGATVNYTIRIKGLQFELGSSRTTYQPAVSGELRNRAIGSGDVGNATYWPASAVQNGITATKVASGIDTDGLPYVDVRYTGTASSTFHTTTYAGDQSRTASGAVAWSSSFIARVVGGSTAGVTGIRASVREETAPSTFIGITDGNAVTASTDTQTLATRTLSTGNQASVLVGLNFTNGATIDVTYRIKGLQFEQNATYSRYQRTITANEWYEPGFTSYRGIRFDGVDDFLQTAAIDFSNSDKMTVVAGVRKLSDAARSSIVELTNAAPNRFSLEGPDTVIGPRYGFLSSGSITSAVGSAGFAAPHTAVVTGQGDISGDSVLLRVNSTQVASSTADQGTGNFANDIVYIGRRGGTTLPFNGVLTFLCVINRTLTAGELAALEAYANSRTGAY